MLWFVAVPEDILALKTNRGSHFDLELLISTLCHDPLKSKFHREFIYEELTQTHDDLLRSKKALGTLTY